MGSIKMVLVLTITVAFITMLSANYTEWINKENVNVAGTQDCRSIIENRSAGAGGQSVQIVTGMECGEAEGSNIFWFNLLLIAPFVGALGYALVPFVK